MFCNNSATQISIKTERNRSESESERNKETKHNKTKAFIDGFHFYMISMLVFNSGFFVAIVFVFVVLD